MLKESFGVSKVRKLRDKLKSALIGISYHFLYFFGKIAFSVGSVGIGLSLNSILKVEEYGIEARLAYYVKEGKNRL